MKTYDISNEGVTTGIEVAMDPYPHIVLGEGGHKRATWIALGKRDAESIVKVRMLPCPNRGSSEYSETEPTERKVCDECGQKYGAWEKSYGTSFRSTHPQAGEVNGPQVVEDVGIIALKDEKGEPNGKYLIVAPRNGGDNRVLVLWRVRSGYRGGASIAAGEGITVIASDKSWHSGAGNLGETAEVLAVLKPGQELRASRSGRRVQDSKAKLVYDGKAINVTFGGEEMEAATADEQPDGDYL